MATVYQNLSEYDFDKVPDASSMRFGIVASEWNQNITEKLLEGACNTLKRHGVSEKNVCVERVPGSFELTYGARKMAESKDVDAIIVIGCVVRGDTPHFDYVCSAVTQGAGIVQKYNCALTRLDFQQEEGLMITWGVPWR